MYVSHCLSQILVAILIQVANLSMSVVNPRSELEIELKSQATILFVVGLTIVNVSHSAAIGGYN